MLMNKTTTSGMDTRRIIPISALGVSLFIVLSIIVATQLRHKIAGESVDNHYLTREQGFTTLQWLGSQYLQWLVIYR